MIYCLNTGGIHDPLSSIETVMIRQERSFRELGVDSVDILCHASPVKHPYETCMSVGYDMSRVVWMPAFFAGRTLMPSQYTLEMFESTLDLDDFVITRDEKQITYKSKTTDYTYIARWDIYSRNIAVVSHMQNGLITREDFYTDGLLWSTFYIKNDKNQRAHVMSRYYYADGRIACEEYIPASNYESYYSTWKIGNDIYYSKTDVIERMLSEMNLSEENDILIINRDYTEGILGRKSYKNLRIYYQFHALHFTPSRIRSDERLSVGSMSKFIRHANEYTGFIVATDKQNEDLTYQLEHVYNMHTNVYTIPVGSLDRLYYPEVNERVPHAFMTAAVLSILKGHDLTIQAIVRARKVIPDITLDIYGAGECKQYLEALIKKLGAEDYIKLKGFVDLTHVYKKYDAHILASSEEGCSCVCMEAIGSGCGLIGYGNVRYYGPEFIKDGVTGCAGYYDMDDCDEEVRISQLTDAIIRYCQGDSNAYHTNAYNYAKRYLTSEVTKKWKKLLTDAKLLS